MDGLECSEFRKSLLNDDFRIDSEYYKKRYLREDLDVKKFVTIQIKEVATVSDGQHGYHEEDSSSPIHMLTAKNAKDWFANLDDTIHVAKWVDDNNKRSSLAIDDIILSTRGTVGKCALVKKDVLPANLDQDVARISFIDTRIISGFALCYLNSIFGQDWMIRNQTGMVQQGLSLEKVRQMPIPQMTMLFQKKISEVVETAFMRKTYAEQAYNEANTILSNAIGQNSMQASTLSIKKLSKSFLLSGRLDAEYYQPKYDALFDVLSKFEMRKLGGAHGLVSIAKSIEPGSEAYVDEGIPFIRVSDVSKFEISKPEIKLRRDILPNPEVLFPQKDTILLSKDGSVGIAYKVESSMQVITSGALLHLTVRDKSEVLPDYLTLVLNSPIVQLQAERDSNGAIIQHWKPSEIENVIIPVLDMDIQKEIATKVRESFALRKQSKQLLEYAKQAVEMAIEQGEDVAMEWLKDKV